MAFVDIDLQLSAAQAITATAVSAAVYDVTGAGVGNVPKMIFGVDANGVQQTAGFDIGTGAGMNRPVAMFTIDQTFTAAGAATLVIQIEAAPDNGSGSEGAYTVIQQTGPLALAQLVAGQEPLVVEFDALLPGEVLPRFYKFNYVVATGPFIAGELTANILLDAPSIARAKGYPGNFVAV